MYCGVPITMPSVVSALVSVSSVGPAYRPGLGQAKIKRLHPIPRKHDVLRLHVAMGDARAVRAVERVGYLGRELQCLIERNRPLVDAAGQKSRLSIRSITM
jgi:hypothetical protein